MHTRGFHGPSGHGKHQNPTGFGKKKGHYPTGFDWKNGIASNYNPKIRKYWSFHTKHKVFMITLTCDGGSVRICERTRHFGYEVAVTIDAVDWIIETVKEVQQKEERRRVSFKRSFRNSSSCYFVEYFLNTKGSFLKISVLKNNMMKTVIIPEEEKANGWSEFLRCLNSIMKREQAFDNENRAQQKADTSNGRLLNQRSWANVVKEPWRLMTNQNSQVENGAVKKLVTANKAPVEFSNWKIKGLVSWDFLPKANGSFRPKNDFPLRRMKQRNFHEFMQAKQGEKDWKKAVIMFRDNSGLSWSCIFYNLSRELGRKLQVSQMFDDRTIIWCRDETEVVYFLEKGIWSIPGTGDTRVSFKRWSAEEQNRDIKVECRGSWIGVKGLPLNIWNMKLFRKIGALCGGLLDVEKDTAEMNFLHHLRVKLEGDNNGFVPESLSLEFEKSVYKLELFKLNDLGYKFSGFFNTCWHQDFEIGRRIEDERDPGHHEEVGEEERNQELGRVSGCEKDEAACSLEVEPEPVELAGSDEFPGGVDLEAVGWDTNVVDSYRECKLGYILEDDSFSGHLGSFFGTVWNAFLYLLERSYISFAGALLLLIAAITFVPSKLSRKKRVMIGIIHVSAHLFAALVLMLLLELGVETCIRHNLLATSAYEDEKSDLCEGFSSFRDGGNYHGRNKSLLRLDEAGSAENEDAGERTSTEWSEPARGGDGNGERGRWRKGEAPDMFQGSVSGEETIFSLETSHSAQEVRARTRVRTIDRSHLVFRRQHHGNGSFRQLIVRVCEWLVILIDDSSRSDGDMFSINGGLTNDWIFRVVIGGPLGLALKMFDVSYHTLYQWYRTVESEHFPDPTGLRVRIEQWTFGFYPACIKYLMAAFDVPEVMAVARNSICKNGMESLSRGGAVIYYASVFLYFWVFSTPIVSLVFGSYLYICVNWLHVHFDEAFSSLRIANYKAFTRFHITKDGDLEVFTLAVDKVPKEWKLDPDWDGEPNLPHQQSHCRKFPSKWSADVPHQDPINTVKIVDQFVVKKRNHSDGSISH
ncbi:hypothetical protein G4B88_012806 [Cannabis sativa]|uniref:DUF4283 domain-containing protein n=1 Tax=Cannabis sativa TaxID=3483 RepID=A0A7J6F6Q3_CANSA|nr:hypothetical protein G4B88_012806 [Cannabis sativa]